MPYTARQVERIKDAVAAGRAALHEAGEFDPRRFARVYVEAGGPQVPGRFDDAAGAARLGEALLAALGTHAKPSDDPHVARELARVMAETEWARAAESDRVVGFSLRLGARSAQDPTCRSLLNVHHGLGPGVFRKSEVVVLPPECDDVSFLPVTEDEIEQ